MSYLLEFPIRPLPNGIRSPPYVVFGIRGKEIVSELPPRIPLNVVLHFTPKLRQWVLPPPKTTLLPWSIARFALHTPYIGIDILSDDIEAVGLKWILNRMLQASGCVPPKNQVLLHPALFISVSIHKTWLALELPISGIQGLDMQIQTRLMFGATVTFAEMIAIWESFPHESNIVRAMGLNFVHSHINLEYTYREFSAVRDWYLQSRERYGFFKSLQDQFPEFEKVQDIALKVAEEMGTAASAGKTRVVDVKAIDERNTRIYETLGSTRSRKVSPEGSKQRHDRDIAATRPQFRRPRSDESIRSVETVIWDPPNKMDKKGKRPSDERTAADMSDELEMSMKLSKALKDGQLEDNKPGLVRKPYSEKDPGWRNLAAFQADEESFYERATERSEPGENQHTYPQAGPSIYATLQRKTGMEDLNPERRLRRLRRRWRRTVAPMTGSNNEEYVLNDVWREDMELDLETLGLL